MGIIETVALRVDIPISLGSLWSPSIAQVFGLAPMDNNNNVRSYYFEYAIHSKHCTKLHVYGCDLQIMLAYDQSIFILIFSFSGVAIVF